MDHPIISDRDIESFQRDGAVCLRDLFDKKWIDIVRSGIEKTIANPSDMHRVAKVDGESGHFFKDYHMSRRLPEFRDFVFESPAGPAVAALLRSSRINFFYDVLWIKEPGTSKRSAWHQDQPYHTIDGQKVCVLWLPLDPIDRSTSLICIKGSHRWNRWFSPVWFENSYGGFDYDYAKVDLKFEKIPDFDAEPDHHEFLSWEMELGDCIVFHGLTVHGAKGNPRLDRRRRALSTTWLGDDAVYGLRPGKVQIETAHFGLAPGQSMDCEHCPRVWPREKVLL